jgi:hypothetical protein
MELKSRWYGIKERCNPASKRYNNCTLGKEWEKFENFEKWYYENYYSIEEPLEVDKDLLVKGNRMYSPDTCLLLPRFINTLITKTRSYSLLPIGVKYNMGGKFKYVSTIKVAYQTHTKRSNYITECFDFYKEMKEKEVKMTAEYYKDKFPPKVYNALINYNIEILEHMNSEKSKEILQGIILEECSERGIENIYF